MFILSNCQFKDPIKGHGINFLENRSEKLIVNKSNKNDVINILGKIIQSQSMMKIYGFILIEKYLLEN